MEINTTSPRRIRTRGGRRSRFLRVRTRGGGLERDTQSQSQPERSAERGRAFGRGRARLTRSGRRRGVGRGESDETLRSFYVGHEDFLPESEPLETPLHPKKKRKWQPEQNTVEVEGCTSTHDDDGGAVSSVSSPAQDVPQMEQHHLVSPVPSPAQYDPETQPDHIHIEDVLCSVPSPAQFVECGGSGASTPRSLMRAKPSSERSSPLPPVPSQRRDDDGSRPSTSRIQKEHPLRDEEIMDFLRFGSDDESDDETAEEDDMTLMVPRVLRYQLEDEETSEDPVPNFAWPPHVTDSPPSPAVSSPNNLEQPELGQNSYGPSDLFEFNWRAMPTTPIRPSERREGFFRTRGPTRAMADPYDAFTAIWDRPIMQHIVSETNRYAEQIIVEAMVNETVTKNSRLSMWKPTNVDEMYIYFAIYIAMGIVVKSDVKEYWNKEEGIFHTPGFSAAMSRNRFILLNRCLHFNNNELLDTENVSRSEAKLFKIAPIVKHLNEKFADLYELGQNLSLDESLTLWKGWLNIRQCIPNKAANVGIKTFEVCESQTGYLYRFKIYSGRDDEVPTSETPISGYIPTLVFELLKGLEHRGHCIWMDNYYNSPALARTLKTRGFDCVGTLRTNRMFVPREINDLKSGKIPMQKGQIFGCTSGDIDVMVWKDTRNVAFVSTYHGMGVSYCPVEKRRKPTLVRDYNVCMGGIDKKDQMLSTYPIERKRTHIWYKKFFRRLLNASILNAHIISKESLSSSQSSKNTHRAFRQSLVKALLSRHQIQRPALASPPPTILPLFTSEQVQHFTVPYGEAAPGSKEKLRRSCVVCHKRVRTQCPACNVALCMTPCAQSYHQRNQI